MRECVGVWVLALRVGEGGCVCAQKGGVFEEFCLSDRVAAKGLTFPLLSQAPLECWSCLDLLEQP